MGKGNRGNRENRENKENKERERKKKGRSREMMETGKSRGIMENERIERLSGLAFDSPTLVKIYVQEYERSVQKAASEIWSVAGETKMTRHVYRCEVNGKDMTVDVTSKVHEMVRSEVRASDGQIKELYLFIHSLTYGNHTGKLEYFSQAMYDFLSKEEFDKLLDEYGIKKKNESATYLDAFFKVHGIKDDFYKILFSAHAACTIYDNLYKYLGKDFDDLSDSRYYNEILAKVSEGLDIEKVRVISRLLMESEHFDNFTISGVSIRETEEEFLEYIRTHYIEIKESKVSVKDWEHAMRG